MNQQDIIQMAREAGAMPYTNRHYPDRPAHAFGIEQLERFADLVAAAERDRIKAANAPEIERINAVLKKLSEENTKLWGWYHDAEQQMAILQRRARGETK